MDGKRIFRGLSKEDITRMKHAMEQDADLAEYLNAVEADITRTEEVRALIRIRSILKEECHG